MKLKPQILFIAVLIFTNVFLFAQDRNPEENFKWFPKGQYESIKHYSPNLMKEQKCYADYDATVNGISNRYYYGIPLPEGLLNECAGYTKGKLVKVKVEKLGKSEEVFRPASPGGLSAQADIAGEVYQFSGMGDDVLVVRFTNLGELLNKSLKDGGLIKLNEKLLDLDLLKFWHKDTRSGDHFEYFIVATPTDEILVSNSKETLKRMINAGRGEAEGFLENQEYYLLTENMEKFSQSWEMTNFKLFSRVIYDYAKKKGASQKELLVMEENLKKAMEFNITGFLLGDRISLVDINLYPTKEAAKAGYEESKNNYGESLKLDGFLTIFKETWDSDRVEQMKSQVFQYKAKMEEEEAKNKEAEAKIGRSH